MYKFVVLLAAVACAHAEKAAIGFPSFTPGYRNISDTKVINGANARLGQFPYQVSLQLSGGQQSSHFCGGSLITTRTVLTAGHCITEVQVGYGQHVEVLAGLVSLRNRGQYVQSSRISRTIIHPRYTGGVTPNDIAIHILTTPFKLNSYVALIGLPRPNSIPSGRATLSGWGSTSRTSQPNNPDHLQWQELPIVDMDTCLRSVQGQGTPMERSMVCTGPLTGGYGACNGDSGGPLVQNGVVVGVVSWGFVPCGGDGRPSVFSRTSYFLDFINQNTVQ